MSKMVKVEHGELPKKYQDVGVEVGFDPPTVDMLRLFIVGSHGSGKSTLMGSRPRNLVLSAEKSGNFVTNGTNTHIPVGSWTEYEKIMKVLESDKDNPDRPFDCVTFDPIDMFLGYFDEYLLSKYDSGGKYETIMDYGSGGKGVALLRVFVDEQISKLEEWGYSWMVSSYIVEKMQKDRSGNEIFAPRISLYPSITTAIARRCDYVLPMERNTDSVRTEEMVEDTDRNGNVKMVGGKPRMKKVRNVEYIDRHVLVTTSSKLLDSKIRIKFEEDLDLTNKDGWDIFSKKYDEACSKLKEGLNGG